MTEKKVSQDNKSITRRVFLQSAIGTGVAIGTAGLAGLKIPAVFAASSVYPTKKTGMVYRTLGRTGQKVSLISLGAMVVTDPGIVNRAIDLGVNYLDTANCYQGGNNELMLGKVLKTRRKEVFVATKWHTDGRTTTKQALIQSAEISLNRMKTDTIDLIQIHGADSNAQVQHQTVREAFLELKRAGKARFMGFTHHSSNPEIIRTAIKTGWYDAMLIGFNFMSSTDMKAALDEATKANIGVVIMKSVAPAGSPKAKEFFGEKTVDPYIAAIKWVINNKSVSTCNIGMNTYQQMEADMKAIGAPIRKAENDALEEYAMAYNDDYCRMCGACTENCPNKVAAADIMRCRMYRENYDNYELASTVYAGIPASQNLSACNNCGICDNACPYQIAVSAKLSEARSYFA